MRTNIWTLFFFKLEALDGKLSMHQESLGCFCISNGLS